MTEKDRLALIKLNAAYSLRTDWVAELCLRVPPSEITAFSPSKLSKEAGISGEKAAKFFSLISGVNPEKEIEKAEKIKAKIVCLGEDGYPEAFSELSEPPLAFYLKGELKPGLSLGVVGTRLPTGYGSRMASELAGKAAAAGITITSGLARGVDTTAHKAALKNGGSTFAIIGSGLDSVYPPENRKLAELITENGGAVLSEYLLGSRPLPYNFPRRNRLISALSWGVLVIEGGYASGSLITARCALEQNKEVMAVPGPVDSPMSEGPNMLIKEGACLVRNVRDIVDTIPGSLLYGINMEAIKGKTSSAEKALEALSPGAGRVYALIKEFPDINADEISHKLELSVPETLNCLFELEASALAGNFGGKYRTI